MAGRSMPGRVFRTKREMAISAPVLPAETAAWAQPSFTRSMARRIDESFFTRRAMASGSCMSTTSLAKRKPRRSPKRGFSRFSAGSTTSGSPTRTTEAWGSDSRKRKAAGSVTDGPKSPPMQSIAMVTSIDADQYPDAGCKASAPSGAARGLTRPWS